MTTYRAIHVTADHRLKLMQLPSVPPGPKQVRLRVEACGVSHADAIMVQELAAEGGSVRVPGHEVIGRIDAVGDGVSRWNLGQRVGVLQEGGGDRAGGYAELMTTDEANLVAVPDELDAVAAAPLMGTGAAIFASLKRSEVRQGDAVAVHGLGGTGRLAVQFARAMGFNTIAIGRGAEMGKLATWLGVHQYIDSMKDDVASTLQTLGGAKVLLSTVTEPALMAALQSGLAQKGQLLFVDSAPAPDAMIDVVGLVYNRRSIGAAPAVSTFDIVDALRFSLLQNIRAEVEIFPLERGPEAYAYMMGNDTRSRVVLTMR